MLLLLSSCQSIDVRGQFVSDNAIEEINSKKLTQDEIIEYAKYLGIDINTD
jgi:hypothetical protein